jgi:hypothetical protein
MCARERTRTREGGRCGKEHPAEEGREDAIRLKSGRRLPPERRRINGLPDEMIEMVSIRSLSQGVRFANQLETHSDT